MSRCFKTIASFPPGGRARPAGIKKALCRDATGDRSWKALHKMRPVLGHTYDFHIRISCPKDWPPAAKQ